MANFTLQQTGAELQNLINKIALTEEKVTQLSAEVGKRNVGAEGTDESVEEPEDKHATIEYVNTVIASAITNELNADF